MPDSLRADAKFLGDFLLRMTSDDKHDDLLFASGKTKVLPAFSKIGLCLTRHRTPSVARGPPPSSSMENAGGENSHRSRGTLEDV